MNEQWHMYAARAGLWGMLGLGILLRILYVAETPFRVRGHDTAAHVAYIEYVAEHGSVPPAAEGGEFHQPPLYYALAGGWMRMMRIAGRADERIFMDLQMASLAFTIGTLFVACAIARTLFPKEVRKAALFLGLLATLPSLIFVASRISNDTLFNLLAFACLALLFSFWRRPRLKHWYILCLLLGLLALTKMSAYVFIALSFVCFFASRGLSRIDRLRHGAMGAALVVALSAWFPIMRLTETDPLSTLTLGNNAMHAGVAVGSSPIHFLTFNPVELLRHPYNNPWDDAERRQFFWEYFFRSALTGEFSFETRMLNVMLVALGMLLLPLLALGLIRALRRNAWGALPLWSAAAFLLFASLQYRVLFPSAPNQDFRFVLPLAIPTAYFIVHGTKSRITQLLILVFIMCSSLFIFLIPPTAA